MMHRDMVITELGGEGGSHTHKALKIHIAEVSAELLNFLSQIASFGSWRLTGGTHPSTV